MSMSIYLSTLTSFASHRWNDSTQDFTGVDTPPDPYLMTSAAFCSAAVFTFAALELFLNFFSGREHHWRYTLINDVLILFGASGAAGVLTVAARKFKWYHIASWQCPIAFSACCIVLTFPSMLRTLQRCNRELFADSFRCRDVRYTEEMIAKQTKERDETRSWQRSPRPESTYSFHDGSISSRNRPVQLDSNSMASSRPASLPETTAQWSGVSGPTTLARPSSRSAETEAAPAYSNAESQCSSGDCQRCRAGVVLYQMQSVNGHAAFLPLSCEQTNRLP